MNLSERNQLAEIVKQSNEVMLGGSISVNNSYQSAQHRVTPQLNLGQMVVAHCKTQCPECGKYLANVNEHLKCVHLKIRPHACTSCDYKASFKNDLEKHVRSVHGLKTEPQVIIAIKSETAEHFEELVKTSSHTETKFKTCPYCSKSLSNTKEHIKAVHLKEKSYYCNHCEYKTLFKSDLIKHDELVHRKIKKSCPHCGKQVANLHEHIRLVHKKEKKFKCNYCGYMCAKQSDMKKHTRNVHKVQL